MRIKTFAISSQLLSLLIFAPAHAQTTNVRTSTQDRLYRENAPKFHKNFSTGDFDKNGPLVTPDIDVNSNNVKLIGRDNFVKRIKRYSIPFPGMQLRDRVIVVDGNVAAVNYVLQGEHKGPHGKLAPTGNKIEAMSGEVFEFNPAGLMKKLTTITKLDRVEAEINGKVKIGTFENIVLLPNGITSSQYRETIRATAVNFHRNFNAGKTGDNAALATDDVRINADGAPLRGRQALVDSLQRLKTAFPDTLIHDEYVLADGDRAVLEYIMEGTQTGPYTMPDGAMMPPSGKAVRVRGIEFMRFDKAGLLNELIVVHNENDFMTELNR